MQNHTPNKRYTTEQVVAMHEWYMAEPSRRLQDVAAQFGVRAGATHVSKLFRHRGLRAKPIGRGRTPGGVPFINNITARSLKRDPYPTVLEYVGRLLDFGVNADNIGGSEPDILLAINQAVREVLRDRDPASLDLVPTL